MRSMTSGSGSALSSSGISIFASGAVVGSEWRVTSSSTCAGTGRGDDRTAPRGPNPPGQGEVGPAEGRSRPRMKAREVDQVQRGRQRRRAAASGARRKRVGLRCDSAALRKVAIGVGHRDNLSLLPGRVCRNCPAPGFVVLEHRAWHLLSQVARDNGPRPRRAGAGTGPDIGRGWQSYPRRQERGVVLAAGAGGAVLPCATACATVVRNHGYVPDERAGAGQVGVDSRETVAEDRPPSAQGL